MSENNWFVCRPSWGANKLTIGQVSKETEHRIYYGAVRKAWRGSHETQSYVNRKDCIAVNVCPETARAVMLAWDTAAASLKEIRDRAVEKQRMVVDARDKQIETALAQGIEARQGGDASCGSVHESPVATSGSDAP